MTAAQAPVTSPPIPADLPDATLSVATDVRLACMRISRRVRHEGSDALAPHLFSALCRLDQADHTPGELAEIERVSAPSMTRTVRALVDAGLATRTADPHDGRQVLISVTDSGRAHLADARRRRDEWMVERVAQLSDDEIEVLTAAAAVLGKVAAL